MLVVASVAVGSCDEQPPGDASVAVAYCQGEGSVAVCVFAVEVDAVAVGQNVSHYLLLVHETRPVQGTAADVVDLIQADPPAEVQEWEETVALGC